MEMPTSLWKGEVPLVCPRDQRELRVGNGRLICGDGHEYPVASGVPILLADDTPTNWAYRRTLDAAEIDNDIVNHERIKAANSPIDPIVNESQVGVGGNLYRPVVGNLMRYPIPELRLPEGKGRLLLDVGCNWGRWSIAAARKGYRVIGIDPNFRAILAARRVAHQLGLEAEFIVGDARRLPFKRAAVDCVFSYSVLQHFRPHEAWAALDEIARVLKPNGVSLIQMASAIGIRSFYRQLLAGFSRRGFNTVRRYFPWTLQREFAERVGPTVMSVDGYFALGAQSTDADLLSGFGRAVVTASERLRRTNEKYPHMRFFADSLYFESQRKDEARDA